MNQLLVENDTIKNAEELLKKRELKHKLTLYLRNKEVGEIYIQS